MDNAVRIPAGAPLPAKRIPGNTAIWVGVTCEFIEFSVLFAVYFFARVHFPAAFHAGPAQLATLAGMVITLLMVTSSYFIACSVNAIRQNRHQQASIWLSAALLTALGYPLVKYLEVRWNLAHGLNGNAGVFITVYYYLTLNHLVHASWGIIGILYVLGRLTIVKVEDAGFVAGIIGILYVLGRLTFGGYSADNYASLEALGSYWHATDMIWLVLFTLFYLLG